MGDTMNGLLRLLSILLLFATVPISLGADDSTSVGPACSIELRSVCPSAVYSTPYQCGQCAKRHASTLSKASCTAASVTSECRARTHHGVSGQPGSTPYNITVVNSADTDADVRACRCGRGTDECEDLGYILR